MEYNITYRKKDKGIQCIISYKDRNEKWKTRSKQGFKSQRESKPWRDKTVGELKKQLELSNKINEEYQGITFKEFSKVYLKELTLYREPNTIRAYRVGLDKFNKLKDKTISDIKFSDIKNIVNDMLSEGLEVSTINLYISRINGLLDVAVEEYKIISKNPLKENKIRLPRAKEIKKIKALNNNELNRLINIIKPEKDRIITIIASKSGLRSGEILGLTWDDIDFENMDIIVNKQWKQLKSGKHGFGTVKSINSNRRVPISPYVFDELSKYKEISPREFKYNRLFIETTTNSMCTRLNYKFKKLGFDISLHDLRHTYATNLISIGIDFKTVAEFMGDTVEMVINTYAHFNEDMYEAGREKINKFL